MVKIKMMKLSDLPESCKGLIEALELILVGEILTNGSYYIRALDSKWIIYLKNPNIDIVIPKNVSQHTPPFVYLNKLLIQDNVSNIDLFEKELKENKIVIVKSESYRNMGYIVMGGERKEKPFWQFYFPEQKKFYDFYLICKKYGVF